MIIIIVKRKEGYHFEGAPNWWEIVTWLEAVAPAALAGKRKRKGAVFAWCYLPMTHSTPLVAKGGAARKRSNFFSASSHFGDMLVLELAVADVATSGAKRRSKRTERRWARSGSGRAAAVAGDSSQHSAHDRSTAVVDVDVDVAVVVRAVMAWARKWAGRPRWAAMTARSAVSQSRGYCSLAVASADPAEMAA